MKKILLITATALPLIAGNVLADQVILDDLIVDGSACIGFDCVNGESFGFDTIRIKENNLRIKFQDTSAAASFPSNDWQLTANDSANGGANKFSIDDIDGGRTPFTVEARAPSHSLYVDDGGRLGLGTSIPSVDVHVVSGNTPTLRLDQNGSSGFAPQVWDVAGNETNFFVRDVTNGSRLPFRIRPSAPTNSIFVDVDGDVGMSTASPGSQLHITETAANTNLTVTLDNNAIDWQIINRQADNGLALNNTTNAGAELILSQTGNLTILGNFISGATTLNVPDYVFDSSYDLMPIDEVAKFIEQKNHLPNVASAKEINASEGLNMTQFQMKLLEKIEELTLYTIQQEEKIKALAMAMEKLKVAPKI